MRTCGYPLLLVAALLAPLGAAAFPLSGTLHLALDPAWTPGRLAVDLALAPGFLDHVNKVGGYLNQQLGALVAAHPAIFESVRGQGLMLGLKMKIPNGDFITAARQAGLVVLPAGDNVVRLLPPLTISESEVREGMELMNRAAATLESLKAAAQ